MGNCLTKYRPPKQEQVPYGLTLESECFTVKEVGRDKPHMKLADAIVALQRGDTFEKSLTCSLQVELFDERGKRLATRHVTLFYQGNKSPGDFMGSLMKLRKWELANTLPLVDIVGFHLLGNNMLGLAVQFGTHALFFHELW